MDASKESRPIDLDAVRTRLREVDAPQQWRSLDEVADTENFRQFLEAEFPQAANVMDDGVDRRQFMKLMSASFALAGLNACTRQPEERIIPYVRQPENVIPGEPLYFATAMPLGGDAIGLLVESHLGRPTKIEGNEKHPASLGATDVLAQASVLGLYDPDRSRALTRAGEIRPWTAFADEVAVLVERFRATQGEGLRFLSGAVNSPTAGAQMAAILAELPKAKWHRYEALHRDGARTGALYAFGEIVDSRYRVDKADVILALDADFLTTGPGHVRHARDYGRRRKVHGADTGMNRLYVVESTPSNTGAIAEHRLPLGGAEIESFTFALARALGLDAPAPAGLGAHMAWVEAVAADLQAHKGKALVIPGEGQPPVVHAFAHRINQALGATGATVIYTRPVEQDAVVHVDSLAELVADMDAGGVEALFILGGNPAYDAPADLEFAARLEKVALRVHLSSHVDETSALCHWHVPEAHYLEAWSDSRAFDGTAAIVQPLIAPLYGGRSIHEVLGLFQSEPGRSGYERVRDTWKAEFSIDGDEFERRWRRWLHDGLIEGSEFGPRRVAMRGDWRAHHSEFARAPMAAQPADRAAAPIAAETEAAAAVGANGIECIFRADASAHDGRFANNAWLQELPKPITRLTWDNAALISPALATAEGLSNGDLVRIGRGETEVEIPVWIVPGQAASVVTLPLGYGRRRAGAVGNGIGFDVYPLRTTAHTWSLAGASLAKAQGRYPLVCTQDHHSLEGRDLIRRATLDEYRANPKFAHAGHHHEEMSLYPDYEYKGYSWGMTIDLSSCIGCNACVIACQAENNIPVVGKRDVGVGREMHWIRIDRYFQGDLDNPSFLQQPIPCMQCENAPCEPVCPANATVHSDEGLNDMVYNRCVGTRYCANNCPYKVRRFNFRLYADWDTESLKLQRNPNVTVRSRGVMEKCTYCVQRINQARIEAKREDRKIQDGEIITACQQVCPTEAIVFGDINDPNSKVAQLKQDPKDYTILDDLNTRPRTSYLAGLRNPNPKLEQA